jgi:hypothetical protein
MNWRVLESIQTKALPQQAVALSLDEVCVMLCTMRESCLRLRFAGRSSRHGRHRRGGMKGRGLRSEPFLTTSIPFPR